MEAYSSNLFEDLRQERSIVIFSSLTDADVLKQSKFTDDEIEILMNLFLEKLHKQRILKEHVANFKEHVAMDLLEKQFSN